MNGFFQLQRKFFNHPLWTESREFSRAEAFLDLLQMAAFTTTQRMVGGSMVELQQGEICASLRFLAERWKWSVKKVRTYLAMLESNSMLDRRRAECGHEKGTAGAHRPSILSLCNYAKYANGKTPEGTERAHEGHTKGTRRAQIEEGEEGQELEFSLFPDSPDAAESEADPSQKPDCLPKGWQRMSETQKGRTRVLRNTDLMVEVGKIKDRKESTLWTVAEAVALAQINPHPEEIELMTRFYKADIPKESDFRRTSIQTLLNHWLSETEKAQAWEKEAKPQQSRGW